MIARVTNRRDGGLLIGLEARQRVAKLNQGHRAILGSTRHICAVLLHPHRLQCRLGYLHSERGIALLEQQVPDVQRAVSFGREKDT